MRDLLDIINEGSSPVQGQYLLATYNLEQGTWRVTFYPSRETAFEAYKEWSQVFTGDAYIAPVEQKYHASKEKRSAATAAARGLKEDNEVVERPGAKLIADYADLGVSVGYIGNVYHGPERDDRSFRVFTQVVPVNPKPFADKGRITIHVFDPPPGGIWKGRIEYDTPRIRAELDKLRERVATGELRVQNH